MEKHFKEISRWSPVFVLLAFLFLPAIAHADTDVTLNVEIQKSRLVYDRRAQASSLNISLKNISENDLAPMVRAVIEKTSDSTVQVTNADGTTQEGKPYFDYVALSPGITSDPRNWVFSNPQRLRFTYTVNVFLVSTDSDPPTALITNPPDNAVITNKSPLITIEYHDDGSEIDTDSFQASINGNDVTALFNVSESNASYQLISSLTEGTNVVSASIRDTQGNSATVESNFTVGVSSEPLRYIFSLADNDWVFASPGDGTCISYLNRNALGLTEYSDITALTQILPNDDFYFGLAGKSSIYISLGDGFNTALHTNANMGAGAGAQVSSLHIDLSDNGYFNLDAHPSILQSPFDGTNSPFMEGSLLGIADGDTIECLHIGHDDTIYFCSSDKRAILGSSGSTANTSFLTAADLGVPGSEINAFAILPETVLPEITITYPTNGAFINTTTPNITVSFSDEDSGIDKFSFVAELNGSDVSASFTVTDTGASYQVLQGSELSVGENTLNVSIKDMVGNESSSASNFTIGILRAIPGASVVAGTAPLTVHFTSDGEDPAGTIQRFRWDFDGNNTYDTYDEMARDYNHTYNTPGTYNARLHVWSSTGETASASITITVQNNPPVATADIQPSNGQVPLTAQLNGSGTDNDGNIVLYEWDFDGNGTYDWSSSTTGNTSYTYTGIGTFNAIFRVTDNSGLTDTAHAATTVVRTGPPGSPTATASASPTSGNAPLNVTLYGNATDPDNDIVLYEWDFDGDGTYDWSSETTGNTSHTYNTAGTHTASLRVTDSTGLTGIDQILTTVNIQTSLSVQKNTVGFLRGSSSDIASASASSQYNSSYTASRAIDNNTSTRWQTARNYTPYYNRDTWFEVTFNSPQRLSGFSVRWYSSSYRMTKARIEVYDKNNSILHSEETDFASETTSQINLPGIENAFRLRLVGLASASSYYVIINEFYADSVPMSTGEPEPAGSNINTSISARSQVSILLKDEDGNIVRTLVNNEYRGLGSYTDYWDCKDDNGIIVSDGVYYATLQYIVDEEVRSYDVTNTTGGSRYNPPRDNTGGSTSSPKTFEPFKDEFLPVNFTLSKASEVTLFVGVLYSTDTRIKTVINRVPLPAGSHTIYWDGTDDNGDIAEPPPGNMFVLGIWGYDLPDNAMCMTGGKPEITSISAAPHYYSPFSEKCDTQGNGEGIILNYTVSEDVNSVALRVYSLENDGLIRTAVQSNISAGENTFFWDGKNNNGEYPDIGDYQVGLIARDAIGNESMLKYSLIRIDY